MLCWSPTGDTGYQWWALFACMSAACMFDYRIYILLTNEATLPIIYLYIAATTKILCMKGVNIAELRMLILSPENYPLYIYIRYNIEYIRRYSIAYNRYNESTAGADASVEMPKLHIT